MQRDEVDDGRGSSGAAVRWARIGVAVSVVGVLVALIAYLYPRSSQAGNDGSAGASKQANGETPSGSRSQESSPESSPSSNESGESRTAVEPDPTPGLKPRKYVVNKTSFYTGGGKYYAHVSTVTVDSALITVAFESFGRQDLRKPDTSCVKDASGGQSPSFDQQLSSFHPGHYAGTIQFTTGNLQPPLLFSYSCQSDYSEIVLVSGK